MYFSIRCCLVVSEPVWSRGVGHVVGQAECSRGTSHGTDRASQLDIWDFPAPPHFLLLPPSSAPFSLSGSLVTMASRGNPRHRTAASSASSKRASQAKNAIYPHSLPVQPSDPSSSLLGYIFSFFYAQSSSSSPKARQNQQQSAALVHPGDPHPVCIGFFDALTNSVWVQDPKDAMILWRRGFFGKGSLSRSEPTWKSRKVASLTGNREGESREH